MNPSPRLVSLLRLSFVLLAWLPLTNSSFAQTTERPPNLVLLLSDDMGWTDYGFMGHPDVKTPNLDRLASQAAVFPRGYVPTGLCRPSLMTLLTGHYASTHGITGNDPSPKYAEKDSNLYNQRRSQLISYLDRFETLPEALGKRGYLSHQSGKLWEGSYTNAGFSHGMTQGFPNKGGRHGDVGLEIGRNGIAEINQFLDTAVKQDKPFYLWYAPFMPHTPHTPPKRLLDKYRDGRPLTVAKYYAMCEWFDETCGQIMDSLSERGLDDNTMIVYLTDNGWIQNPNANGYAPRSKQSPYDGGVRTPILYWMPGQIKSGRRDDLATSLDIYPTMLAAAGGQPDSELPGLNLLEPLKTGQKIERDTLYGEGFAHDIADIENPEASLLYRWVIEGPWKLLLTYDGEVNRYKSTHPRTERGPQLFQLLEDPTESKNVAGQHPDIVARLAGKLDDWYSVSQQTTIKTP
ncbi:sulfatase-like hydrolase/transferase [Rhodopirellula sp. MGV]|uniref:sulfatase-like hydrolase/transferase n=1 Tax=Rhodopirellula sp. MGV TaxID=2023130 RepID=UPI000B95DADA|nr:sulfatase-like hydrolase/transferase [Rhodopirellula sp. MGV]OYP33784.1 sulfatase [Rhodopirellula sp. MGV]PNY37550.1 sulfatase [Rhodopirellula baltica]